MIFLCWSESVWNFTPEHPWIANIIGIMALLELIYASYQLIQTLIYGEMP